MKNDTDICALCGRQRRSFAHDGYGYECHDFVENGLLQPQPTHVDLLDKAATPAFWAPPIDVYDKRDVIEDAMKKVAKYGGIVPPTSIYVIGSMRNPRVPEVAKALRALGYDAFDDWYSVGPEADDKWQEYEKARGRTFAEALEGYHAKHVFELDLFHLDRCAAAVLVAPAGKSAHAELGYMRGAKKPTFYLLDGEPERFDIMLQFASGGVFTDFDKLALKMGTVLS